MGVRGGREPCAPWVLQGILQSRATLCCQRLGLKRPEAGELPFVLVTRFQEQVNKTPVPPFVSPSLPSNSEQMKQSLQKQSNSAFYFVALKVGA